MKTKYDPKITPWQIQEQNFPRQGSSTAKLEFLLHYAILAPSGHNSQPWKFSVSEDEIRVFADKTRWLKIADPDRKTLHISLGCALENLLIAGGHFGYGCQVTYFPKPDQEDLVAAVQFMPQGQPPSSREPALFAAITARHTNRKFYDGRPIPSSDRLRLQETCSENDLQLNLIDNLKAKQKITDWLINGHTHMLGNPAFRKESASWLGRGLSNMPRPLTKLMQLILPHVNPGKKVWTIIDSRSVMCAPVLAVLSSSLDDRKSQVKIGRVFERICLTATMLGIRVQPMSPIVDLPELRTRVAKLLPNPDVIPQHAFRLGYAEQPKAHAQRRPLDEVLILMKEAVTNGTIR